MYGIELDVQGDTRYTVENRTGYRGRYSTNRIEPEIQGD
jgi:hypothetical protein